MKDEIGAELKGPLEQGGGEGIVDKTEGPVVMGDFRRRTDVRNSEQRVGRRLDPDKPGAPSHGALDLADAGGFNEGKCEPEVLQHGPEKPVSAAIDIARGDDVIPLLEQQHRSGRRAQDRKSTRLNSSHGYISYAV